MNPVKEVFFILPFMKCKSMSKKLSTVLLIDDDEPTNYLNKLIIEETGCAEKIKVVQSGNEAIKYLAHTGKKVPPPELIFLDINMPAMDGWEFLEEYKKISKGKVVMFMLTTSLNPDDEERSKMIKEISGFKNKPLTKEIVLEILENHFN